MLRLELAAKNQEIKDLKGKLTVRDENLNSWYYCGTMLMDRNHDI